MNHESILQIWRYQPEVASNIVVWRSQPERRPQFQPLPPEISSELAQNLHRLGIDRLYSHQAKAWQIAAAGHSLAVVTGTASGKTLCYNLPVLSRLLADPTATALYIFPTKALAQDQINGLHRLLPPWLPPATIAVYDGDTPSSARSSIRKKLRLLVTNPDMLHAGILPHHTLWADFLANLAFIVIDEMHIYRGVFGSHVANVLRRLKRANAHYRRLSAGSPADSAASRPPQFILTSATIANPLQLAEALTEEEIQLIDEDGSARGQQDFLVYNPPVVNQQLGIRRSALQEAVRLTQDLLTYNIQTVIFGRSRRAVELMLTYLRNAPLDPISPQDSRLKPEAVRGYRSGYLAAERREIEQGLRDGSVRAVAATSALELGVDIGGMGAAILVGYPGTVAATRQQAGRAGRGSERSLAVLVSTADPLDQFLASHPNYLFDRSPEQALINPDHLLILLAHLRCAAFELPFTENEIYGKLDPALVKEYLDFLVEEGTLHLAQNKVNQPAQYFWMAGNYPAQGVSLRSASADTIVLQAANAGQARTVGLVDRASSLWMVHPGAIYLHEGQSYQVEQLDLESGVAWMAPAQTDFYTEPLQESEVQLLNTLGERPVAGGQAAYGEISVTTRVVGYRKIRWYTHEHLAKTELDLPPTELQTTGFWVSLSEEVVEQLRLLGMWRSDPNNYGPLWPALRDRVRQRDGFRCRQCGAPETSRQHDVHHITPYRSFASVEAANRMENLITLCPACHHRAETAVRIRSGFSGLAYTLVHLAPLFLMCDTRDLGMHSDPQSPLTGGRPTVILYDQTPAGIGFSQRLYELHEELAVRARELVSECPCEDGCPSCVGPGGENGLGGKQETLAILEALAP